MNIKKSALTGIVLLVFLFFIINMADLSVFQRVLYPYPYKKAVEKYSETYGIDPLLVISVIREESRYYPRSISKKGATGLMQIMPNTAKEIAAWLGEKEEAIDLLKPDMNIRYGTWYLSVLHKEYKGNLELVLASYNAGSGRVNSWLRDYPGVADDFAVDMIPFVETREYVTKVLRTYGYYTKLYGE